MWLDHPTGHRTAHGVDDCVAPRQLPADLAQLVHTDDLIHQSGRTVGTDRPATPDRSPWSHRPTVRSQRTVPDQPGDTGDHDRLALLYVGDPSYGGVRGQRRRHQRERRTGLQRRRQPMYGRHPARRPAGPRRRPVSRRRPRHGPPPRYPASATSELTTTPTPSEPGTNGDALAAFPPVSTGPAGVTAASRISTNVSPGPAVSSTSSAFSCSPGPRAAQDSPPCAHRTPPRSPRFDI